jgi:hypothetical protein
MRPMETRSVEALIRGLNAAGVRYLIVGGLAVVAHGYLRLTKDVDLVLTFADGNAGRALDALATMGYRPAVPVQMNDFLDAAKRREWIDTKNARVFPLVSDAHRFTPVEIFLEEPFDFEAVYRRAVREEVAPGVAATFVDRETLLAMKRAAGREQDLADVAELERLHGLRSTSE